MIWLGDVIRFAEGLCNVIDHGIAAEQQVREPRNEFCLGFRISEHVSMCCCGTFCDTCNRPAGLIMGTIEATSTLPDVVDVLTGGAEKDCAVHGEAVRISDAVECAAQHKHSRSYICKQPDRVRCVVCSHQHYRQAQFKKYWSSVFQRPSCVLKLPPTETKSCTQKTWMPATQPSRPTLNNLALWLCTDPRFVAEICHNFCHAT